MSHSKQIIKFIEILILIIMRHILVTLILMLSASFALSAQGPYVIKGSVVDSSGEPLIGVSVLEKGTTNGTITDIDGKFSIEVKSLPTYLVLSHVGFRTKEYKISLVGGKYKATLIEDGQELDEVVPFSVPVFEFGFNLLL